MRLSLVIFHVLVMNSTWKVFIVCAPIPCPCDELHMECLYCMSSFSITQVSIFPTIVGLLPTLITLATFSTLSLKCESIILPLKWKLFLLSQTLVPHETFLSHHPCDVVDTLQWRVSYSTPLWLRWLSIQVKDSLSRTKGFDTIYLVMSRSINIGSRATHKWERHHIST